MKSRNPKTGSMTDMQSESSLSLRALIGRNVRRLRTSQGLTAEQLAVSIRNLGLSWTASRVSELERGQKAVGISDLLIVGAALSEGQRPEASVRLEEFFVADEWVELTDVLLVGAQTIREAFRGGPSILQPGQITQGRGVIVWQDPPLRADPFRVAAKAAQEVDSSLTLEGASRLVKEAGAAERKAAKSLGVGLGTMLGACSHLWGRTLSAERDRIAGGEGTKQARGHVTRELVEELARFLGGAGRGDD